MDKLFEPAIDLLEQIEGARSQSEVIELLEQELAVFGVKYFMIGQLSGFKTNEPLLFGTYHTEWQERFFAKNYFQKDPTILNLVSGKDFISIKDIRNG